MNLTFVQGVVQRRTTILDKKPKEKVGVISTILNSRRNLRNEKSKKKAEEERLSRIKLDRMRAECERSGKWTLDVFFYEVDVDIKKEVMLGPKPDEDKRFYLEGIKQLPPLADSTKTIHLHALAGVLGDKELKKNFPFTLRFMALGVCYGEWYLETPNQLGFYGDRAEEMARSGLILIKSTGKSNLPLFYSPSLRPR